MPEILASFSRAPAFRENCPVSKSHVGHIDDQTSGAVARGEKEIQLRGELDAHSEKRLARRLLKLARFGLHDVLPSAKMPRMSHETLAEMVGTTRSRVTHFMNKFRKLGLIDYEGNEEIIVRAELLTDVVLHD